ncbi:family 43 glycosylhydrolase [Aquincola sp. S2]|uniref:Family 43 glycosylhydrolase n=2 Tax=Pseudaquabacterium terrae TaxID=2732868 RepID=A0ABX2ESH8_9BURK|nr:family 43 glycosylhydrolase [Aquabacterium terrae]
MTDRPTLPSSARRRAMKAVLAGATGAAVVPATAAAPSAAARAAAPRFGRGVEGQRQADLGDGTYLNPIVPGDHPDPTILKDGADYYMTFSSFQSTPGAVIWHSRDLVNWTPITAALLKPIGTVWAMDLVKHGGRYFLYIPVLQPNRIATFVVHADHIRGPWSEPIDLGLDGCIDPGHIVGEDGRRYLFVNGFRRIGLADDGLSTVGRLEPAHTPWQYPQDWVVEMFAPEGPKLLRRGDWFYMISAVGGTSGPPTSHMVTVARARSIHGPWQDCPFNPIVRTRSADEPWWSRGHASVVEGPAGDWWMVYHGYENGFRTLGRQTLLEPIEWTADGWLRAKGGTLDRPLRKPRGGQAGPAGLALSDDFRGSRIGLQWSFFDAAPDELARARHGADGLTLRGKGSGPADCSPLTCLVGERSYEAELDFEVSGQAVGGLALFYDARGFVGLGIGEGQLRTWQYGQEQSWMRQPVNGQRHRLKVTNREHIVTFHHAAGDGPWVQHPWQMEVSGFHQNVFGGFLSLRIALIAAGQGDVRLTRFSYRGLGT